MQLVASKYQQPRGPLMVDNYFWGELVGTGTKLAADDYSYPRLDWSTAVSKVVKNDDGGWSFQFSETMTVRCGTDVQMKAERREVWDASLALDNATGAV